MMHPSARRHHFAYFITMSALFLGCSTSAATDASLEDNSASEESSPSSDTVAAVAETTDAAGGEDELDLVDYAGRPDATPTTSSTTTTTTTVPAPSQRIVTLDAAAGFDDSDDQLSEAAVLQLTELFASLETAPPLAIEIDAWADSRGATTANFELSARRASAVERLLVKVAPDLAEILTVRPHGETDPPIDCLGDCPSNRIVRVTVTTSS